jgi:YVTN family beta-propeller protein
MKIKNKRNINVIKGTKVNFKFKVKNAKLFKPLIWSTHTKLPLKLKLTKKGLLKGIAKKAGVFKIKIKVVNNKKQSVSKVFILNIKNTKPKPTTTTTTAAPTTTTPNPSGLNVYVTNFGSDVVSIFERNISTGALSDSSTHISENNPSVICISVDGKNVYVANYESNTISIFDRNILDGSLSGTATIPTGTSTFATPRGICISFDGKNVYVATLHNDVSIYDRDIETGLLIENGTIDTEIGPSGICISVDGKNVYVANSSSDTVSIYDRNISTGSLTLYGTVATGIVETNPVGICISVDGKSVYVANRHSDTVANYTRDVSTGSLNLDGSIDTQDQPEQICISEDGKNVYVTNLNSNTVSIFDRDILDGSLSGTSTIGTGETPAGICISLDGKNVYVANATSNTITIYDRNILTGELSIASTIETLINPSGICIYPTIYTSNKTCFYSWGVRGMIAEYDIDTAITSDLIGFTRPTIYGLFYLSELDTYCITFSEEPVSGPFIYSVKGLQVGNTITLPDLWKDTIIGGPYPDVSGTYYVIEVKYNLTDSSENFFQEYAVLSCVPNTNTTTTTTSTTAAPNTFSCFSSWACPNGLYSRALITGLTSGATWQGYQGTFRSGGISLIFQPLTPPYFTDDLAEVPVTKQGTFMIDEEVVITGDNLVQTIDGVTYNWAGTFVYAANFGDQHYLRCVGSSPWNGIIPTANCQNTTTTTTTTTTPPQ